MVRHFIVGSAHPPVEAPPLLAALGRAGFPDARAADQVRSGRADVHLAIYYDPARPPVFVRATELSDDRSVATSAWEMVEELLRDPVRRRLARSLVEVRHYEGADPAAVEALASFLEARVGSIERQRRTT